MMKIEAYAKFNLTLEVFGVRPDGYHALRSLVVPVSLSDTLTFEPADRLTSDVPYADDLCVKAAKVLDPSRGASIRVIKRIPAGGGLGGGSADAAATLRGLNGLWGLGRTDDELAELAAQVGSDVPALTLGGPVLMLGRGESVVRTSCPRLDFVLVSPGVHTSTREVYARCAARAQNAPSATDACVAALASGELGRIASSFVNDLTAPACGLHPEIADAFVSLRAAGAIGVSMSGSGSSVFGLVDSERKAGEIAEKMRAKGLLAWSVRTLG